MEFVYTVYTTQSMQNSPNCNLNLPAYNTIYVEMHYNSRRQKHKANAS